MADPEVGEWRAPAVIVVSGIPGLPHEQYADLVRGLTERGLGVHEIATEAVGPLAVTYGLQEAINPTLEKPLPSTITFRQFRAFTNEHSAEGVVKVGPIWDALLNLAHIVSDSQEVARRMAARTEPLPPHTRIRLGPKNDIYSIREVDFFARLSLRFLKDVHGTPILDVDSVYQSLKYAFSQAEEGVLPVWPQLGRSRIGLLVQLVNEQLRPEEPLSLEGIKLR